MTQAYHSLVWAWRTQYFIKEILSQTCVLPFNWKLKQTKCPSAEECIMMMWSLETMGFYSPVKKKEIINFARKWLEWENTIHSEVTLSQKGKFCVFFFICVSQPWIFIFKHIIETTVEDRKVDRCHGIDVGFIQVKRKYAIEVFLEIRMVWHGCSGRAKGKKGDICTGEGQGG